jgi:hypothetical protein
VENDTSSPREVNKKKRTTTQKILAILSVVGVSAAVIWRIFWPVTGVSADLFLIAVMLLGAVALKVASRF